MGGDLGEFSPPRLPAMADLRISLAGAERIDELEPIYRVLYDHHLAVTTWRPAPERGLEVAWERRRKRYESTLSTADGILLVAERDGRVVGALIGEVEDGADGSDIFAVPTRIAHVHDVAVLPEAQGSGVGRVLMERFEALLRERDVASYGLDVIAGNELALRFYESLGFERSYLSLQKRLRPAE
jgi:ribosomal protein S18 acetylase RimI-like enzyme